MEDLGTADPLSSGDKGGEVPFYFAVVDQLRQRGGGANGKAAAFRFDAAQLFDLPQADDTIRLGDPLFERRDQVGPPGQNFGPAPTVTQQRDGFLESFGSGVFE